MNFPWGLVVNFQRYLGKNHRTDLNLRKVPGRYFQYCPKDFGTNFLSYLLVHIDFGNWIVGNPWIRIVGSWMSIGFGNHWMGIAGSWLSIDFGNLAGSWIDKSLRKDFEKGFRRG